MDCHYCERRCAIQEGGTGFCQMYRVSDGEVIERFPHRYSSLQISHIESIPFYHFQPGSRTLMLGGAGCNFDCHYCSNAYVARSEPSQLLIHRLTPDHILRMAKQAGCHNIAFAVNEPTVFLPSLFELSRKAAAEGIPVGALTNGYTTSDVTTEMARRFSFLNVSIKSLSDSFYQAYIGVPSAQIVLRNVEILQGKTHLEISTPIIGGLNDSEIASIASFIHSVGPHIPWHVFRLLPEYKMSRQKRPDVEAVSTQLNQARRRLHNVYFGNFAGSHWVSTYCSNCGEMAVERVNIGGCTAKPLAYRYKDGRCLQCGSHLPIAGDPVEWNSKEQALCEQL